MIDTDARPLQHVPENVHAAIRGLPGSNLADLLIVARQSLRFAEQLAIAAQRGVVHTVQLARRHTGNQE